MTHEEIYIKLREIIQKEASVGNPEQKDLKVEDISLDTHIQHDLGCDSMSTMAIVMDIEDEFDIDIPDDALMKYVIVKDAVAGIALLLENQNEKES